MNYDSTADTNKHRARVSELLDVALRNIRERADGHDASKLLPPEKEAFDIATPKLKTLVYGTPEYAQSLADLKPALDHHYAVNRHHPEHNGIPATLKGMTLFDLLEMLCDWKAASERTAGGSIEQSFAVSAKRFSISPEMLAVLQNTAAEMGF